MNAMGSKRRKKWEQ